MDDFTFGIVSDAKVAKAAGATDDTVVVLKKYDEGRAELPLAADADAADVTAFIATNAMRLVTTFSPETAQSIFGGPITIHALIFAKEMGGALQEMATAGAKANRGSMLFVHVPPSETRVTEFFGIKEEQMPTMVIADMTEVRMLEKASISTSVLLLPKVRHCTINCGLELTFGDTPCQSDLHRTPFPHTT